MLGIRDLRLASVIIRYKIQMPLLAGLRRKLARFS